MDKLIPETGLCVNQFATQFREVQVSSNGLKRIIFFGKVLRATWNARNTLLRAPLRFSRRLVPSYKCLCVCVCFFKEGEKTAPLLILRERGSSVH